MDNYKVNIKQQIIEEQSSPKTDIQMKFEELLDFVAEKYFYIKSNIILFNYFNVEDNKELYSFAPNLFNLVFEDAYNTIVVSLRALLTRKSNNSKEEKTIFSLLEYAQRNEKELFNDTIVDKYRLGNGEILEEKRDLEPIIF